MLRKIKETFCIFVNYLSLIIFKYTLRPRPYQRVGSIINISGWVPKKWLEDGKRMDYIIFVDILDIDGKIFVGSSINLKKSESDKPLSILNHWLYFSDIIQLDWTAVGFLQKSQGRITIKLSGQKEKEQSVYIPIIIEEFEHKGGLDITIKKKHGKISKMIKKYEKDLEMYYKKSDEIYKKRQEKNGISNEDELMYHDVQNMEMVFGVLDIIGSVEDFNKDYPFSEEDKEEQQLEEEYKDAINWKGPLLGGIMGRMSGFEFAIYSNDHDRHFHVMNRGKGINARFSFPEIELINYKNIKASISRKEIDRIVEYFKNPENFKRLEDEFNRRETLLK